MPLWGAKENAEKFPTWLNTNDKRQVYATEKGWVYKNPTTGTEEVLVAARDLHKKMGAPTPMEIYVNQNAADGANLEFSVVYNTKVTITGQPKMLLSGYRGSGLVYSGRYATYVVGGEDHEVKFAYTPTDGDSLGEVLLPAQINYNGGSINSSFEVTQNSTTGYAVTVNAEANVANGGGTGSVNLASSAKGIMFIQTVPYPTNSYFLGRSTDASNVDIVVNFNEDVWVNGKPYIAANAISANAHLTYDPTNAFFNGSNTVGINYLSGNGTSTLTFRYTPVSGDNAIAIANISGNIICNAAASINSTSNVLQSAVLSLKAGDRQLSTNLIPSATVLSSIAIVKTGS